MGHLGLKRPSFLGALGPRCPMPDAHRAYPPVGTVALPAPSLRVVGFDSRTRTLSHASVMVTHIDRCPVGPGWRRPGTRGCVPVHGHSLARLEPVNTGSLSLELLSDQHTWTCSPLITEQWGDRHRDQGDPGRESLYVGVRRTCQVSQEPERQVCLPYGVILSHGKVLSGEGDGIFVL